nr:cytochrome c peroxidase [Acidomonas methanolica]
MRHFRFDPVLAAFRAASCRGSKRLVEQNRMPPWSMLLLHPDAYMIEAAREAVLNWVHEERRRYYATAGVAPRFAAKPIQPIPESLPVSWEKVALGRDLFFDKRLSGNRQLNCASCHGLKTGGAGNLRTATGVNGQKGSINVPSVYDAAFNIARFRNARAKDLAAQAAEPVTNPVEMGSHNWGEMAATIRAGLRDAL